MKAVLLSLSTLALLAGTPVAAKDFVVQHDDLDLASAAGQKTLEKRIDAQAREFCGEERPIVGTRIKPRGASECFRSARQAAREQMGELVARAQKGG